MFSTSILFREPLRSTSHISHKFGRLFSRFFHVLVASMGRDDDRRAAADGVFGSDSLYPPASVAGNLEEEHEERADVRVLLNKQQKPDGTVSKHSNSS